jgi:hydrogenase nickel incorporation protein HypA/HybF
MHELAITQSIVAICLENAAGRKVLSVEIEVGELSGVVPEALEFCFEACSSGTLLENARLEIIKTAGEGRCIGCSEIFGRDSLFAPCPVCGGYMIEQLRGEELRIRELEVDDS